MLLSQSHHSAEAWQAYRIHLVLVIPFSTSKDGFQFMMFLNGWLFSCENVYHSFKSEWDFGSLIKKSIFDEVFISLNFSLYPTPSSSLECLIVPYQQCNGMALLWLLLLSGVLFYFTLNTPHCCEKIRSYLLREGYNFSTYEKNAQTSNLWVGPGFVEHLFCVWWASVVLSHFFCVLIWGECGLWKHLGIHFRKWCWLLIFFENSILSVIFIHMAKVNKSVISFKDFWKFMPYPLMNI